MASWLAFLKSKLLIPRAEKERDGEMPAEELAAALAFRLRKLEAMRKAGETLTQRPVLGREIFTRGDPEATVIIPSDRIDADLYGLMSAYVSQRRREARRQYTPGQRIEAFPLEAARDWLRARLPTVQQWTPLTAVAPDADPDDPDGPSRASYLASTLSAGLELVKEGAMDVRQEAIFADLYVKRRGRGQPLELTP
jgi:segregation and condensation protein A